MILILIFRTIRGGHVDYHSYFDFDIRNQKIISTLYINNILKRISTLNIRVIRYDFNFN